MSREICPNHHGTDDDTAGPVFAEEQVDEKPDEKNRAEQVRTGCVNVDFSNLPGFGDDGADECAERGVAEDCEQRKPKQPEDRSEAFTGLETGHIVEAAALK
jgi:hypothetical protein